MSEDDLADALHQLTRIGEQAEQRQLQRNRVWDQVAGLSAIEVGAGGALRVTIGSGGELTVLDLAEPARSMPAAVLAAQILAAVRRAQATLARQVAALAAHSGPDDDPIVAGIASRYRSQFPDQPPDTGPPPGPPAPMPRQMAPHPMGPHPPPQRAPQRPPHLAPPPPRQAAPVRPVYEEEDDYGNDTIMRGR